MRSKLNGLLAAALLVLLANGFVLVQVAWNRSGTPVAEIELTDREVRLLPHGEDDSGVDVWLVFQNPGAYDPLNQGPERKTFLALEYNGPAWQAWRDRGDKAPSRGAFALPQQTLNQSSQLLVVDSGPDAAALRRKYPDTKKVLILPGAGKGEGRNAWLRLEVSQIHVPLPEGRVLKDAPHYRIRLRQGPSLELWVAGVERIVG